MSKNNEALITIESTDLIAVSGGRTDTVEGGVTIPGRGGVNGRGTTTTTNYESCLEGNRRQAQEAFPDNRWFWQRWMGQTDPNARARADYERAGTGQCTVP